MWAAWHATALWESMWTLSWKPVTPAIVYNAAKLTRYWSKVWPIITIVFWYILRNISVCVNLFYPKFAWPTLFHSAVWFHSRLKTGEAQDGMKMRMYSQQGKTWHSWVMLYRLWQSCIVMLLKSPPRTPYQQPHIYTMQCLKLKLFVFFVSVFASKMYFEIHNTALLLNISFDALLVEWNNV